MTRGRPKSQARLSIESNISKSWLEYAYHADGPRYVAKALGITPWTLLRIIDGWGIPRVGNSNITPNARTRMIATIFCIRRSSLILLAREVREILKKPLPEDYPFIDGKGRAEQKLLVLVNDAVPRNIPEFRRVDICQDLLVAILEGKIETSNLKSAIAEFIKSDYRLFPGKYGPISIDRPIRKDGEGSLLRDFIVDPHAEKQIYENTEKETTTNKRRHSNKH